MGRFGTFPEEWLDMPDAALKTLLRLSLYAHRITGECWPSNAELERVTGKSERAVQKDLKVAEEMGFISRIDDGGRNRRFRIESRDWFAQNRAKTVREDTGNPEQIVRPTPNTTFGDEPSNPEQIRRGFDPQPRTNRSPNPEQIRRGNPEHHVRGPNKNYTRELHQELKSKQASASEESEPDSLGGVCEQALADLSKPKPEIPADLKRSVEQLGLHSWLGMLVDHGISPTDWRIREVVQILLGKADLKNPFGLARKIFNDLPEQQPAKSSGGFGRRPTEPAHVPNLRLPEKPKSENEAAHTEFLNRLGMSAIGSDDFASAINAINAVSKSKPPEEYRRELEAIARKFEEPK